jgi:hypothetical protein
MFLFFVALIIQGIIEGKVIKEFKDSLSSTQKTILSLLDMDENKYWGYLGQYLKEINSAKTEF